MQARGTRINLTERHVRQLNARTTIRELLETAIRARAKPGSIVRAAANEERGGLLAAIACLPA
jgi:hypothetical protein